MCRGNEQVKEAKEAKETKKRGRMIDGQSGGLQIMGDKRRKKQEVAFGRGSRQLRDDEDALDEDFYFSHKIYSDAK